MKGCITIGSLAKLTGISTHQIRYFEEKEIFSPQYTDSNGYRMYGVLQINTLNEILFLRKLRLSVSEIKTLFNSDFTPLLQEKLHDSIVKITEEISILTKIKKDAQKMIDLLRIAEDNNDPYTIKNKPKRYFYQHILYEDNKDITATDIVNASKNKPQYFPKLEDEIIYISDNGSVYACTEIEDSDNAKFTQESGNYLCSSYVIKSGSQSTDNEQINDHVKDFMQYAKENNLRLTGNILFIESTALNVINSRKAYFQIQRLIDETINNC